LRLLEVLFTVKDVLIASKAVLPISANVVVM
jgi:hypothetical protein